MGEYEQYSTFYKAIHGLKALLQISRFLNSEITHSAAVRSPEEHSAEIELHRYVL